MSNYYFKGGDFVIENYNKQKTFANFLPGVAGKKGIPLWNFYVNRAQCMAGFGLQDKSKPIMSFTPANKAYEVVSTIGFRTFIKTNDKIYEPFKIENNTPHKMIVSNASFRIEETNSDLGLNTKVTYFTLPNTPLAGLVRKVEIESTKESNTFEILDGLTEILPSGVNNSNFKEMSNLLASWMDVDHLDEGIGFFKLRASTNDSSEVTMVKDGNFYLGFDEDGLITPVVDQDLVFGYNTSKSYPTHFEETSLDNIKSTKQVTTNKIPCAFIPQTFTLNKGETKTFYAVSGYTHDYETLKSYLKDLTSIEYMQQKERENQEEISTLLNDVKTDTAHEVFNHYIEQNYLDNFLRGGYPVSIGDSIYHLYSRRHGDLERDYNFFSLAPEYYSQGAGNFRDVCQNRRMDTFINKDVEAFNIHQFASLVQLDGYNPLSVNGTLYALEADKVDVLMQKHFKEHDGLKALLSSDFTPGQLVNFVENHAITIKTSETAYLNEIIKASKSKINAAFGEGYWSDHFTYILDLVESYESIYPDKLHDLLYKDQSILTFESPVTVRPKSEKTVITKEGSIRQYGSVRHFDDEKVKALNLDIYGPNWAVLNGKPYQTNLFTKLLTLVLNKHSLLDPEGYGIEMEGDKPGWNDAMNGVPGLFGSGVGETIEVLRIVEYLLAHQSEGAIELPKEIHALFEGLTKSEDYASRVEVRETYRQAVRLGLSGETIQLKLNTVYDYLETLKTMLQDNLSALHKEYEGILPTFLVYEVTDHEPLKENGEAVIGHYKLPLTKALAYKRRALPRFLEAPARLLKTDFAKDKLAHMAESIIDSGIYDQTYKMYKTSESLEHETHEIGRIRAFTKGWLERESNFLHMSYKYLLGLLKAGLYKEYYEAIQTNLTCFMDPSIYGRNTLENSSFIAPSNNPNEKIHGQGFFARLSGSTVETINMWAIMMTGGKPFKYDGETLSLRFEPKLDASFFKEDGTLSFTFLKTIKVTYINKARHSTYNDFEVENIELINDTERLSVKAITGALAEDVRAMRFNAIKIYIKS